MTLIQQLLPDLVGFTIEQVMIEGDQITIRAQSQTVSALCPACSHPSSRIHSRYKRQLADLPWGGRSVRLVMQVRRFFCPQQTCSRKTFAEVIPTIAERYGRRTLRLKEVLEQCGLALGGEAAARLMDRLKMQQRVPIHAEQYTYPGNNCLRYEPPYPSHPKKLLSHRTHSHSIGATYQVVFAWGQQCRDEVVNMSNTGQECASHF